MRFLKEAIDSALSQTVHNISVLVCDDCGPDSQAAAALVQRYQDRRLTFARNERNLGLAGNWNRCLDLAATELVTILHADDRLRPNYANVMLVAAAAQPQATAFYCSAGIIGEHSKPIFSFPDFYKRFTRVGSHRLVTLAGDEALAALLRGWFIMCPTLCYRKSKLGAVRFSTRWQQVLDVELIAELLFSQHQLVGLTERCYSYRRHGENQTARLTRSLRRFHEEVAMYNEIGLQARAQGWVKATAAAEAKTVIKLNLLYCAVRDLASFHTDRALSKIRLFRELAASPSLETATKSDLQRNDIN